MTGEERERKMLEDQIERAKAEAEALEKESGPAELQKKDGEKISLSLFGSAPPAPATEEGQSTSAGAGPSKATTGFSFGSMPTSTTTASTPAANPLKRPAPMNIFKSAKTPKPADSDAGSGSGAGKQRQLSEVERLMKEDQARKANRAQRGGYQGQGPRRG